MADQLNPSVPGVSRQRWQYRLVGRHLARLGFRLVRVGNRLRVGPSYPYSFSTTDPLGSDDRGGAS